MVHYKERVLTMMRAVNLNMYSSSRIQRVDIFYFAVLTTPPGAPDFTLSVYFESNSSENISEVKCDGVSLGCLLNLVVFPEYKRGTKY